MAIFRWFWSPKIKFVSALLIFILSLGNLCFLPISETVKCAIAVGIILLYLIFLFWASANIRSGIYIKTFNSAPNKSTQIAVTFDDGPDVQTDEILNLLQQWNAKATFFMIGQKIFTQQSVVRRVVNEGHEIGNHSWAHSILFSLQKSSLIQQEIIKTDKAIKQITGKSNQLFRPPFGVTNPLVAKGLRGMRLTVVGWSVRSFDTKNEPEEVVFKRIKSKVKGGDIILLHDTSKNILPLLNRLLPWLKAQNYELVTVGELMK